MTLPSTSSVHDDVNIFCTVWADLIWKWSEAPKLRKIISQTFLPFASILTCTRGYIVHSYGRSLACARSVLGRPPDIFQQFEEVPYFVQPAWDIYACAPTISDNATHLNCSVLERSFPSILIVLRVRGVKVHGLWCWVFLDERKCLIYWSSLACSSGYEIAAIYHLQNPDPLRWRRRSTGCLLVDPLWNDASPN